MATLTRLGFTGLALGTALAWFGYANPQMPHQQEARAICVEQRAIWGRDIMIAEMALSTHRIDAMARRQPPEFTFTHNLLEIRSREPRCAAEKAMILPVLIAGAILAGLGFLTWLGGMVVRGVRAG